MGIQPDWIAIILTALSFLVIVIVFIVRVSVSFSVALSGNTEAIKTLTDYLEKQDKRNDKQDEAIEDHEVRIVRIEQTHKVKGC